MKQANERLAVEYYTLVGQKDMEGIKNYLHPDLEFSGPFAKLKGRTPVLEATSNFAKSFRSLTIRAHFASDDQAMVVYSTDIPEISNAFPGASLLTIRDGLIVKIELFYDGSRFMEQAKEIFQSKS